MLVQRDLPNELCTRFLIMLAEQSKRSAIQRNFCSVQCQVSAITIEQRNESASLAIIETLNRANRKQAMLDAINDNDFLWRPVHRVQLQRQEWAGKQMLALGPLETEIKLPSSGVHARKEGALQCGMQDSGTEMGLCHILHCWRPQTLEVFFLVSGL